MTNVQFEQLIAALVGAIAAGLFRWLDGVCERRRNRESTLVAIVSEVATICDLIRHQGYFEAAQVQASAIRNNCWDGESFIIDIRANYFAVFEALSAQLGLLRPIHVSKIVSFYGYCKSVIDSTRPVGPLANGPDREDVENNILVLEGLLSAVLLLGEQIQALPKKPLPKALA